METLTIEDKIENLGTVSYVKAPFDKALQTLTQNGYTLISTQDLAYARTKEGKSIQYRNTALTFKKE